MYRGRVYIERERDAMYMVGLILHRYNWGTRWVEFTKKDT